MENQQPTWVYVEKVARGWVTIIIAAIGAGVAFWVVDWPRRNAELEKSRATTRIATQQAAKNDQPIVTIHPKIVEMQSNDDIRDIVLETKLTNEGFFEIRISEIKLDVFRGSATNVMATVIQNKQRIRQIDAQLAEFQAPTNGTEQRNPEDRIVLAVERSLIKTLSPVGEVFAIDRENKDIEWRGFEKVSRTPVKDIVLKPEQSIVDRQTYVLVEDHSKPNQQWFQFRIVLKIQGFDEPQVYDFTLPGMSTSIYDSYVAKTVLENGEPTKVREWTTDAPLAPTPQRTHKDKQSPLTPVPKKSTDE